MSRESISIIKGCRDTNLSSKFSKEPEENCIPIGSIEYCENSSVLKNKKNKIVNFYPNCLSKLISRTLLLNNFKRNKTSLCEKELFIKDAEVWKNDKYSKIFNINEYSFEDLDNWFYVSTKVNFIKEWRYYIAYGQVLDSGIYAGEEENENIEGPDFPIKLPNDFFGAVDLGLLDTGKLELVEAHPPFACGFYSEKCDAYTYWMYLSWENCNSINKWMNYFYNQ